MDHPNASARGSWAEETKQVNENVEVVRKNSEVYLDSTDLETTLRASVQYKINMADRVQAGP